MKKVRRMPIADYYLLRATEGLNRLRNEEFDCFIENMTCTFQPSGSVLFREKWSLDGVYILVEGVIKQTKQGKSDREYILRLAKCGDILGFRSSLIGEPACSTVEVIEDAIVCYMPGALLNDFMRINSAFSNFMLNKACCELGETQDYILSMTQKKVRERVAEVLIQLMTQFSLDSQNKIKIALSRREIACMIGTTPESVIRMLCDFKDEKVIDLHGSTIQILNEQKLFQISNNRR